MKGATGGFIAVVFMLMVTSMSGQTGVDTVSENGPVRERKGSIFSGRPGKSFLLSMVVPGAGQIYNKSYLRVPFVWGAVGGMGLLVFYNSREYVCFRDAYVNKIDGVPLDLHSYCYPTPLSGLDLEALPAESIRVYRDRANVYRQWAIIGFSLVWLANGVDAFVDAHLKEFDIDEDLSIDFGPKIDNDPYSPVRMGVFVKF